MEIAMLLNYMRADSKYDIFEWQRYLLLEFQEAGLHINAHGNILKCLIKGILILYSAMFIMEVYLPHRINVIHYIKVASILQTLR
jgi:hypothetical protein